MEKLYFLVSPLAAYNDQYGFHRAYFATGSGFTNGLVLSCIIGLAFALIFYFAICNGKSTKPATRINWIIMLGVVAVITYFAGDFFIIGSYGQPGTGFYKFCQDYANNYMANHTGNQQVVQQCMLEFNTIIDNLKQGKDVAFMFNSNNVIFSVLVYFLTSLGVKNFTKHGSQIPF